MSKFECLYSFSLCFMDLRCPLLRGSSDRRLRRCAATADISKGDLWWFFFLVKLIFCKRPQNIVSIFQKVIHKITSACFFAFLPRSSDESIMRRIAEIRDGTVVCGETFENLI